MRLLKLGATPIVPRGAGDESHALGLEAALIPWMDALWDAIVKLLPLPPELDVIPRGSLLGPKYIVAPTNDTPSKPSMLAREEGFDVATLLDSRYLTSDDNKKKVKHLSIAMEDGHRYTPHATSRRDTNP